MLDPGAAQGIPGALATQLTARRQGTRQALFQQTNTCGEFGFTCCRRSPRDDVVRNGVGVHAKRDLLSFAKVSLVHPLNLVALVHLQRACIGLSWTSRTLNTTD
jgi:hypothetical protein